MNQEPPASPPWHLYLIECRNGALYAGISNDVAARYEKHCSGKGARYTRANPPVKLIGSRACGTKSDALKAEHAIRKLTRENKILSITTKDDPEYEYDNPKPRKNAHLCPR